MNKVYKVIWNATLGVWVAVSEVSKSKTKTKTKTVSAVIALSSMVSFAPNALAEVGTAGGTGSGTAISQCTGTDQANASGGTRAIAIGCNSESSSSNTNILSRQNPYNTAYTDNQLGSSVAIGSGAKAGTLATAIGGQTQATGGSSTALGPWAQAAGESSFAVGRQSAAIGNYSQAIGNVSAATGNGALSMGHSATATGYRAIAIGTADIENPTGNAVLYQDSTATKASGRDSIALGGGALATQDNTLAIGKGANANVINSVALGTGSTATAQSGAAFLTNTAASAANGVVSVGTSTATRRIQNVADGAADQDAVTIAQLKAQKVLTDKQGTDTAAALGGGSSYNATTGAVSAPSYNVGGTTVTGVNAALTNIDGRTTTNTTNITNLQNQTFKLQSNGDTATAVKSSDTVQFLNGSNVAITRSGNNITVGTQPQVSFDKVTVGNVVVDKTTNKITGVENGNVVANSKDAVNGGQLFTTNQNVTTAQNTANTATSKADAAQATADKGVNFSVNGGTADNVKLGETVNFADGTNTKAVYDAATNTYKYNIVDAPVFAGQVKANGFDANGQKIVNVADGTVAANSKDAVNGGQLFTTNQKVDQNTTNIGQNTTNISNLQNQTFKLQANGDTASAVKSSDTVQFLNGRALLHK